MEYNHKCNVEWFTQKIIKNITKAFALRLKLHSYREIRQQLLFHIFIAVYMVYANYKYEGYFLITSKRLVLKLLIDYNC